MDANGAKRLAGSAALSVGAGGRFLSVDPVKGGCANAYVYVFGDPVNQSDLSGRAACETHTSEAYDTKAKVKRVVDKGNVYWEFRITVTGLDALFAYTKVQVGIVGGINPAHDRDRNSRMPGIGLTDHTAHTRLSGTSDWALPLIGGGLFFLLTTIRHAKNSVARLARETSF